MVENLDWNVGRLIELPQAHAASTTTRSSSSSRTTAPKAARGSFPNTRGQRQQLRQPRPSLLERRVRQALGRSQRRAVRAVEGVHQRRRRDRAGDRAPAQAAARARALRRLHARHRSGADVPGARGRRRIPARSYKGREVYPITGKSLLPRLENRACTRASVRARCSPKSCSAAATCAAINWKLSTIEPPYRQRQLGSSTTSRAIAAESTRCLGSASGHRRRTARPSAPRTSSATAS